MGHCSRDLLSTPGVLDSRSSYVVSIHHRLIQPHPPVPQARCDFVLPYTQRLRCAGAPRRPTGPSLLSLLCFPCMSPTLPRRSAKPSHCTRSAIPGFLHLSKESPTATPSLPAISDGQSHFGVASFALCYDLHVCLALLTGYDEMKSRALHRAF